MWRSTSTAGDVGSLVAAGDDAEPSAVLSGDSEDSDDDAWPDPPSEPPAGGSDFPQPRHASPSPRHTVAANLHTSRLVESANPGRRIINNILGLEVEDAAGPSEGMLPPTVAVAQVVDQTEISHVISAVNYSRTAARGKARLLDPLPAGVDNGSTASPLFSTALSPQFPIMTVLRYGTDRSVRLEFADGVTPAEYGTPRGLPLDSPADVLAEALQRPLDYPPLAASATPGDRVVLAMDPGTPQGDELAAVVIRALLDAGVDPDGISVLRTQADVDAGADDPRRLLPEAIAARIVLVAHDPADRRQLALLSSTKEGHPILLNRVLHEADLVVPIGCLRGASAGGYYGIHTAVFPTFSDLKAAERFRCVKSLEANGTDRRRLVEEVEEVAWLLGVNFTVQLVPAAGDAVMHVVAGQSEAVGRRGRQLYDEAWSWKVAEPASLVVAAIEGDACRQTWHEFGRALDAAVSLIEEGGSIAVCCDLAEAPGAAIQRMVGNGSRQAALRAIRKEAPADALPAVQLARALDRGKVYLLSRLDPSLVDALEMIHVAEPDELARLARRHPSCILLANASRTEVTVAE